MGIYSKEKFRNGLNLKTNNKKRKGEKENGKQCKYNIYN
jgi:hypothetical protein